MVVFQAIVRAAVIIFLPEAMRRHIGRRTSRGPADHPPAGPREGGLTPVATRRPQVPQPAARRGVHRPVVEVHTGVSTDDTALTPLHPDHRRGELARRAGRACPHEPDLRRGADVPRRRARIASSVRRQRNRAVLPRSDLRAARSNGTARTQFRVSQPCSNPTRSVASQTAGRSFQRHAATAVARNRTTIVVAFHATDRKGVMTTVNSASPTPPEDERRLGALGLSTDLFHNALRPGLSRAANRTSMALRSTRGTDLYHDTMEQFHLLLADAGWSLVYVNHQPRLLHPDSLISFTIASGTNVANPDRRQKPRTRRKGTATRGSLAGPRAVATATLFEVPDVDEVADLVAAAEAAPMWLLVYERTERGLNLEFGRPAGMTASGIVTRWADSIAVGFLDLDGDLSIFDNPDDDDDGDYEVTIEPR